MGQVRRMQCAQPDNKPLRDPSRSYLEVLGGGQKGGPDVALHIVPPWSQPPPPQPPSWPSSCPSCCCAGSSPLAAAQPVQRGSRVLAGLGLPCSSGYLRAPSAAVHAATHLRQPVQHCRPAVRQGDAQCCRRALHARPAAVQAAARRQQLSLCKMTGIQPDMGASAAVYKVLKDALGEAAHNWRRRLSPCKVSEMRGDRGGGQLRATIRGASLLGVPRRVCLQSAVSSACILQPYKSNC